MRDNRCVKEAFWKDFLDGEVLHNFLLKVADKENGLQLRFRGNDTQEVVTIYYNNHMVWKITRLSSEYKVEVSANHAKAKEKEKLLTILQREPLCFSVESENAKKYPYVKGNIFSKEFVDTTYEIMVNAIRDYMGDKIKEKYQEKRKQQELFEFLTDCENGFYAYDLEFKQKGEKCNNEPDMLAIRYKESNPQSIVLIEIKSKRKACEDGNSGIKEHLDGMHAYMKMPYMENRKQEAHDIISAYKGLNLHNPPQRVPEVNDINTYEMAIILTNDAVDYYHENEKDIRNYINEKGYKCGIYEWTNDRKLISL